MAIQSINGAAAAQTAPAKAGGQVSRDDFMKLLIAQLKNQDPLSPMDNQEFAAQLAQFNSLEQLIGLNEKFDSLATQQGLATQFNSAALIGKQVAGNGNKINLDGSGNANLHYVLGANAAKVTVKLLNSAGLWCARSPLAVKTGECRTRFGMAKTVSARACPREFIALK